MLGGLAMIAAIAFFIMVHEAGHFFAAKATDMKATEFFLGFGPRIWSTTRGDTEYGVKAIPFGGYVRIVGMNPLEEVDPADYGRTYREKKFWQKSFVVLAGVVLNFLMAYLILFGLLWAEGRSEPTTTVQFVSEEISEGVPSPAAAAGVLEGDTIIAVDGIAVSTWDEATSEIAARPGETVTVDVERGSSVVPLTATLASANPNNSEPVGFLGVGPVQREISIGPFEAAGWAGQTFWTLTDESIRALGRLVQPSSLLDLGGALFGDTEVGDDIRPVSPIGLVQIGSQAGDVGVGNLLFILASVNIILGLFNTIPLYPLDGGHFAVALYEKVTKREADVRRLAPIAAAVIALMVFLGVVAIVLDLTNPLAL